jgi:hypothetical protein
MPAKAGTHASLREHDGHGDQRQRIAESPSHPEERVLKLA